MRTKKPDFLKIISQSLTKTQYDFILAQMKQNTKSGKGRRWSKREKSFRMMIKHKIKLINSDLRSTSNIKKKLQKVMHV